MSKKRKPFNYTSKAQKNAIREYGITRRAKERERKRAPFETEKTSDIFSPIPAARTATGKVPKGRTLKTRDDYLRSNTSSKKERPLVVIEADDDNNLAVVPLSSRNGKNRTQLKKYQQGQSYFKHYIEIEDDEGKPIRINEKFNENHPNMDVSRTDVDFIIDTTLNHSVPMQANRKKINKFRGNKNPRD